MSSGTGVDEGMRLGIVSDELKLPQSDAFSLIHTWEIGCVEFRSLTGGRIPDGNTDEAWRLVQQYNMEVTSLSPGVFKCRPEDAEIEKDLERLKRTIDLCRTFDCRQIIVFTLQDVAGAKSFPSVALDAIRAAGVLAARAGARLALENEPGYHAVTCRQLAALIDAVGMENVGANWDPGNAWPFDDDIADGPNILGGRIFNVHAKDGAMREGKRAHVPIGEGEIDWKRQVDALRANGYTGMFVVETHCVPGLEKSSASVGAAKRLLGIRTDA